MKGAMILLPLLLAPAVSAQQIAIRGELVHTMAGEPIRDGVVLIRDGKITEVGPASRITIPQGFDSLSVEVVTPGLVDARSVVGLSGYLNQDHDQDQLDKSQPMQPELRAIDAYNPREMLVGYIRQFGVTTLHTGHAPGQLISGQTLITKTRGDTVEQAVFVDAAMIAATLGGPGRSRGGAGSTSKGPGTRAKAVALLRAELLKAREYVAKRAAAEQDKQPDRNLRLEALAGVLNRETPLLISANRHHDIMTALRLAEEFDIRIVLDGAAEIYEILEPVRAAGVPVILHPTMARAQGDRKNLSFTTAAGLKRAGIPFAIQTGFEGYVPKTRVLLFEAALAAANGLSFQEALAAVTIDSARILGVADRVGSLEPGKDGDVALFDGDPFEYTTHCVGVVIEGVVVSEGKN